MEDMINLHFVLYSNQCLAWLPPGCIMGSSPTSHIIDGISTRFHGRTQNTSIRTPKKYEHAIIWSLIDTTERIMPRKMAFQLTGSLFDSIPACTPAQLRLRPHSLPESDVGALQACWRACNKTKRSRRKSKLYWQRKEWKGKKGRRPSTYLRSPDRPSMAIRRQPWSTIVAPWRDRICSSAENGHRTSNAQGSTPNGHLLPFLGRGVLGGGCLQGRWYGWSIPFFPRLRSAPRFAVGIPWRVVDRRWRVGLCRRHHLRGWQRSVDARGGQQESDGAALGGPWKLSSRRPKVRWWSAKAVEKLGDKEDRRHHHADQRSFVGQKKVVVAVVSSLADSRSFKWFPSLSELWSHYIHELGFLASLTQLIGATVFWISGFTGLPGIMSQGVHGESVLGSVDGG